MAQQVSAPQPEDLQSLISNVLDEKYSALATLCADIDELLPTVRIADVHNNMSGYIRICQQLKVQVERYMRLRRLVLNPYIIDLVEKEEDGHDCRSCGGGCSVRHASHIASINEAHGRIKELMYSAQTAGLSLYNQPEYSGTLRQLHTDILMLDTMLSELFFIEESALIPMLMDLQRNIGAHE